MVELKPPIDFLPEFLDWDPTLMSLPNESSPSEHSRPGAYAGRPRPEGETITLFIIGMGLMVTGFFAGWMYFQIRQGLGPGRGKERIIPSAVSPIPVNEDPWVLLGPDNLSWKVMAPRGEVVLEIDRVDRPLQTIRIPHEAIKAQVVGGEGSNSKEVSLERVDSKLVWIRQKSGETDELWTIALGASDGKENSQNKPKRETFQVLLDPARMGPVARGGPVRLDAKEPETLAAWEQKSGEKAKSGSLKRFRMIWVPGVEEPAK